MAASGLHFFVYGTLRRVECNHHLLGDAAFLGFHRTHARYTMLSMGWYPAVIDGGHTPISGEVYKISKACLPWLDQLENYPNIYNRRLINTLYGPAWMYFYRQPVAPGTPRVVSGDWRISKRVKLSGFDWKGTKQ
jgi:gamma-glutamylcyclotransferase (GGCT)/AIG2-like uncharacterized protein YtfP